MTRIAGTPLQTQVQNWAREQNINREPQELSLGQLQRASRSLDVPLADLVRMRQNIMDALSNVEAAGDNSADLRAATSGASAGFGGVNADSSPMMGAYAFKGKGAGKGKGGRSFDDASLAMAAMNGSRVANKVSYDAPFTSYKGYRGGSDNVDAFFKSTYSLEDARQAMESYGIGSIAEAKEYIGHKITRGRTDLLDEIGVTPNDFDQHELLSAFDDSMYTMQDARKAVATFPFLHSVFQAKEYIGLQIVNDMEVVLFERGIGGAGPAGKGGADAVMNQRLNAFFKGGYTYEDAEKALQSFDFLHDVTQAKAYIGLKVENGYEEMLRDIGVRPGNFDTHECLAAFRTSGYSVADAEAAVAAFSFLNSVPEAKEYIGLKIQNGYEEMLAEAGINRHDFDSHDEMNAFSRSGYSETDARAALMAFDFLGSIDDAKQYIGLKVINGAESILHDVGITSGDYDSHECLAAYRQAGYTNADADKAAAGWSFLDGRDDAREYIGLKVLNGYEHMLAEVGIEPRYANDVYGYKGKDDAGYWSKDAVYKGKYDTDYDYKYGGYDHKGPDYASKSAYYGKMNYYSKAYAGKYGK